MHLVSPKFKYLHLVKSSLPVDCIPTFEKIQNIDHLQIVSGPLIMRSALTNEASASELQSGKSLSISGIDSLQQLKEAWGKISSQPDLLEVILQKDILWETHVTLFYEPNFFFAELRQRDGSGHFLYWTPLTRSLSKESLLLQRFVEDIKKDLKDKPFWLMELGIKKDVLFLFQLNPIGKTIVSQVLSASIIAHLVATQLRFIKGSGVLDMIKTEWLARRFREDMEKREFDPAKLFYNWEFLFHYFRIYCLLKKMPFSTQSFISFLSTSKQKSWLSDALNTHLELSHYAGISEAFEPLRFGFEDTIPLFIGNGTFQGTVGIEILVCDEISLDIIYNRQDKRPEVIMTKELRVLSHSVLACTESKIRLVLGLEAVPSLGDKVLIDFDTFTFKLV